MKQIKDKGFSTGQLNAGYDIVPETEEQIAVKKKWAEEFIKKPIEKTIFDEVPDGEKETHLVTGSHGHIGSYIVEYLVSTRPSARVICVDNLYNSNIDNLIDAKLFSSASQYRGSEIIEFANPFYDISNYIEMEPIFNRYKPHFVYHQASMLTLDSKRYRLPSIKTNVLGTATMFELALKYNAKKVVFASSASVFGDPLQIPVNEDAPLHCKLLYGAEKIANEFVAVSYADEEKLKVVGLRYFNVYGPRQSSANIYTQVVPKWINAFIDGKPIEVFAGGTQTMDMIFGRDVARLNILAMKNKDLYRGMWYKDDSTEEYRARPLKHICKTFNGFINIGTGVETSVMQLLRIIREELEKKNIDTSKSEVIHSEHDPNLVKRRMSDTTLMNTILKPNKFISVNEGIKITIEEILKRRK